MADKKPKKAKKPTIREQAASQSDKKPRKLKSAAAKSKRPLKRLKNSVSLPDNKFGRFMRKLSKVLVPKYFREAWAEIKQVTWPTRVETYRLTLAVFVFSLIFASIVAVLDYGLDKLFREIIVK